MTREEAIHFAECLKNNWTINFADMEEFCDMAIEALSAESVRGEWIKTMDGNGWDDWSVLKCSLCGATIEDKQCRSWEYNFCPNCGARMEKGDK